MVLGFQIDSLGNLQAPADTKAAVRFLHRLQRIERLRENDAFLRRRAAGLLSNFADGSEIHPQTIEACLELVDADTVQSELFRMASLLWSVPVSQGYGRRMRFLVWDVSNGKLIGLIALGDPPFNQAARDAAIEWSSTDREERLVHLMDAFILGAVPPYNKVLGGKLVASLVRSQEVVRTFHSRYRRSVGLISNKTKRPSLAAVTTSSALGRSSVYNRLHLAGRKYFEPLGFTGGWGHFHVPRDLFDDMRRYLALHGHNYPRSYEFGDGPNWRLRTIRAALDLLGFQADLLRHGVNREVFVSWIADNALEILRGTSRRASYGSLLEASAVSRLARERWMIPRSLRDTSYLNWSREQILALVDWRRVEQSYAGEELLQATASQPGTET